MSQILSGIIYRKTSKSPLKSGGGPRSQNKVSQNTFKNTLEDDLGTFYNITSHIASKYRWYFYKLSERISTNTKYRKFAIA